MIMQEAYSSFELNQFKEKLEVIKYLLKLFPNGKADKLQLIKMLWLADRYLMRQYGTELLRDKYYAMKNGPVPSFTYNIIKKERLTDWQKKLVNMSFETKGRYTIILKSPVDEEYLSKAVKETLSLIYNKTKNMASNLPSISHFFPEWKKTEFDPKKNKSNPIDKQDFFSTIDNSKIPKSIISLFSQPVEKLEISKETL